LSGGAVNDNDDSRARFDIAITCACGQTGNVTWEENHRAAQPDGPQRKLVSVSSGFHAEEGRTQSGDPLVVCDSCDAIQAD
jgi:hypothetical protein